MKRIFFFVVLLAGLKVSAQDFTNAGEYMAYISKQDENITKKYLSYNSAASHGKRARKVEKLRQKLLSEVEESKMNIASMGKFNGDGAFKDSSVSFMKFYLNVLNDDYTKIINMEDIVEQSYDEMEAYFMLQEEIARKLDEANGRMQKAQKDFALKNNIHLIESKDEISEMAKKVGEVNKFYHQLYLIFYKPNLQESYLLKAIEKGNVNAIEQDKNALARYAEEALVKIQALKTYPGDQGLRNSCKQLLQFYQKEANEKIKTVSDYFLVKERFEAIGKEYEKKSNHSKEDVEAYNKSVKDINAATDAYNKNNNWLNEQRRNLIDNWNKSVEEFFDEQMPKYK